ncbi:hypothetical protein Q1695_003285 [Nippostrongylus brasiliensis]|nr:hypothetical protein Q1695_003285 [Nippostrongylus brasiliensis]
MITPPYPHDDPAISCANGGGYGSSRPISSEIFFFHTLAARRWPMAISSSAVLAAFFASWVADKPWQAEAATRSPPPASPWVPATARVAGAAAVG